MDVRVFGTQNPSAVPFVYRKAPYVTIVTEGQITIGAVLVALTGVIVSGSNYLVIARNTSAGGQLIRIGNAPNFAPVAGMLLTVGDNITLEEIAIAQSAIANGAGGTLDVIIYRT